MPDGFTLGAEPSKLDASLVGKHIYMRWKDYGCQLGKVYEQITSANPHLFKKYNYRVVWADTAKGPTSLRVENYAHGSDAALDSWVVLEPSWGHGVVGFRGLADLRLAATALEEEGAVLPFLAT